MPDPTPPILASGIPVHCAHRELADVTTLVPHPRNPNRHPDKQIALLAKVIRHTGWRAPITVSNRSGFVVTGHGRLEAAKLLQVELVPVDRQDFATEADEWAHLVADNRLAEIAETDDAALKALLDELDAGGLDLELAGFDADGLAGLVAEVEEQKADDANAESSGDMRSVRVTAEQHGVILRAVSKLRTDEGDKDASEGRCLELICANFLA